MKKILKHKHDISVEGIDHDHNYDHNHDHDEHHVSKLLVILFILAVISYVVSFFFSNEVIKAILNIFAVIAAGYHIIPEGLVDTVKNSIKRKKFYPNIHLLMTLAAFGAIIIREYSEAALLIIIFAGAHFLEEYAENRSKKSITDLLNVTPQTARLINEDNTIRIINVSDIKINDRLKVLVGDQVPTDGVINQGKSEIDESVITGESIPVFKTNGDQVYGSSINITGDFEMTVTKDIQDTVIAKIIKLVGETKKNISKTAVVIKKIEPIYVTIILIGMPLFYLLGLFVFKWGYEDSFYRTMVYLIGSSPCALAATDIPATLSSISNLAKKGVLVKGGSYVSNIADIKVVAFDKTGTLTEGKPKVTDIYYTKDLDKNEINNYEQIIYDMESKSNHPLANAIINHFNDKKANDIEVENIIGVGLSYHEYLVGKPSNFKKVTTEIKNITEDFTKDGKTVIYFSKNNEVLIVIAILDLAKENAKNVISYLRRQGIKTVMITGDQRLTATSIADKIGIDEIFANVLPDQKQSIIEELQSKYGVTAMLGDGVNDALALKTADIGIAMKSGTDIAIDAADAVLMQNNLEKLVYAHKTSKRLRSVVIQNIIFAMGVVLFLLITNMFIHFELPLAVLIHEGSTVLVILSGLRLLVPTKVKNI